MVPCSHKSGSFSHNALSLRCQFASRPIEECLCHWPWAGEQLGASSPPRSRRPPLTSPAPRAALRSPLLCCVSASARRGRAPPTPGGVTVPASQLRGSQGSVWGGGAGAPLEVPQLTLCQGAQWGRQCSPAPTARGSSGRVGSLSPFLPKLPQFSLFLLYLLRISSG